MVRYAKYTISSSGPDKGKVLKDGHTMFINDIVKDLNRKSYLEGVKKCECEPFQSCEKCKTEWLSLSTMSGIGKDYWIRDKKDVIGVGYLADAHRISFDFAKTPHDFGTPILCAEIKPPMI